MALIQLLLVLVAQNKQMEIRLLEQVALRHQLNQAKGLLFRPQVVAVVVMLMLVYPVEVAVVDQRILLALKGVVVLALLVKGTMVVLEMLLEPVAAVAAQEEWVRLLQLLGQRVVLQKRVILQAKLLNMPVAAAVV
jgi:hypothetical protein